MSDHKQENIENGVVNALDTLREEFKEVQAFAEAQDVLVGDLIKIGTALSGEKDHLRLLEMIVTLAKRFTNADGCTLYIKDEKTNELRFTIVHTESLDIRLGGMHEEIDWPPVKLTDAQGNENHKNVSAHCALTGEVVRISDVYHTDYDFQGTKDFDKRNGYCSKSMLVCPMRNHEDEIIGVIQLLNAQDRMSREITDFQESEVKLVSSLSSQAAISLTNMRLIKDTEDLLQAIVKMVAKTIDEKSPYTAGHVHRVAEFTESIVDEINRNNKEYADVFFDEDQRKEIWMAAWLHDMGKIITPEYIIDKASKLETIFDRIELVKCRIELIKKELIIRDLQNKSVPTDVATLEDTVEDQLAELDDHFAFLQKINLGGEFLSEDDVARVRELAALHYKIDGMQMPLLTENEKENLLVRRGTLTDEERNIINNHVAVTTKMLKSVPFPKKMANVPVFAGMHHEKLDGTGYPSGRKGEEISLEARILAVADIFEALTASDRPYQPGKMLSESMRIVGFMVKDDHLDKDICDLIVKSGLVTKYAQENLSAKQQDDFEWQDKVYSVKKK